MTGEQKGVLVTNFAVYLLVLVWVVLFHATLETLKSVFDPDFRTINLCLYFNGVESILNILIFVPMGLYLGVLFDQKTTVQRVEWVIAISLLFEITQYILAVGTADVMDLINNTMGGGMGLGACFVARKLLGKRFNEVALVTSGLCTMAIVAIVLFVPLR